MIPSFQTNHSAGRCVLVFLRSPDPGCVKTRLAKHLGNEVTLNLYRLFVEDILDMLRKGGHRIIICFHPPEAGGRVRDWLGNRYDFQAQEGNGLGAKMENAFVRAFASGFSHAILTGTDIPDLPGRIIRQGFEELEKNHAVIGPACDGGYYLIGFGRNSFVPDIFRNIAWSTDSVFEKTMRIFREKKQNVCVLPRWPDIDNIADLRDFMQRRSSSEGLKTASYLNSVTQHLRLL